jgi:serine protease
VLGADEAAALAQRLRSQPGVEWVVPNTREHRLQASASSGATGTPLGNPWWLQRVGGSNANAIADRLRGVPGVAAALSWELAARELATSTNGNSGQGNGNGNGSGNGNGNGNDDNDEGRGLGAVVAVLDTGVTAHPFLTGRLLPGRDFVSQTDYANDGDGRDADPSDPGDGVTQADRDANPAVFGRCVVEDSVWHGTLVAGVVIASTLHTGGDAAGTRALARVLPVRVAGKCGAEVADIVDGMRWAAGLAVAGSPRNPHPARVVNISFGGNAGCNAAYQETIDELAGIGVVVVAAAGNTHAAPTRPASCRGVVGVAAVNRDGFKASYSNFGPGLAISTVGGDAADGLWTTLLGDGGLLSTDNAGRSGPTQPVYSAVSGTSMAAPIVAATLALMLDVNPALGAAGLIAGLTASARPHVESSRIPPCSDLNPGRCICSTLTCGAGLLDAEQALRYAASPQSYQAPNWPKVNLDSAAEVATAVALGADRPPNPSVLGSSVSADGGAGATGIVWLAGLAAALLALRRTRPC